LSALTIRFTALTGLLFLVAGCKPSDEQRELEFMPDMYRNPAVGAQEEYDYFEMGSAMIPPPEGTVPVGFEPYPYEVTEGALADSMENPLPLTRENLELGEKYYTIHCRTCHGVTGIGDGLVTQVHRTNGMPVPPSLYTDKLREWGDGQLYHTIVMGQGQMPGYGARISEKNRWAIVHYIRALQVAADPPEELLEEVREEEINIKEEDNPYNNPSLQLYLGEHLERLAGEE